MESSQKIELLMDENRYNVETFNTTIDMPGSWQFIKRTKIDPIIIISPKLLWRLRLNALLKSRTEFQLNYKLEILDRNVKDFGKHQCTITISTPIPFDVNRNSFPKVIRIFQDLSRSNLSADFAFKVYIPNIEIRVEVDFIGDPLVEVKNPQSALVPIVDKILMLNELGKAPDFTCVVDDKKFKVQRAVLTLWSPVFDRMFENNKGEADFVILNDIPQKTFGILLDIMHGKGLSRELELESLQEAVETSSFLEIKELKASFESLITQMVNETNAVELYDWAWKYNLKQLKAKTWHVINHQILKLHWVSDPFTPEEVMKIIQKISEEGRVVENQPKRAKTGDC